MAIEAAADSRNTTRKDPYRERPPPSKSYRVCGLRRLSSGGSRLHGLRHKRGHEVAKRRASATDQHPAAVRLRKVRQYADNSAARTRCRLIVAPHTRWLSSTGLREDSRHWMRRC